MARRQTAGRGRGRSSSGTNPLPIVIGLVVVILVVLGFVFMGGGGDESPVKPDGDSGDASNTATASSGNGSATAKPKASSGGKKYDGKTKAEWRELRKKVDMTNWEKANTVMIEALRLKTQAYEARKSGNEELFLSTIKKAVSKYKEGHGYAMDFIEVDVAKVHENLWYTDAKVFSAEDKKHARWTKTFRGDLQFAMK